MKETLEEGTPSMGMKMIWVVWRWEPWWLRKIWTACLMFSLTASWAPRPTVSISSRSFSLGLLSFPHRASVCPVLQVECSSQVPGHLIPAAANQTQSLSTPRLWVSMLQIRPGIFPVEGSASRRVGEVNAWQLTAVLTDTFIKTEKPESRLKRPRGRPPKLNSEHSSSVYSVSRKSKHGEIIY